MAINTYSVNEANNVGLGQVGSAVLASGESVANIGTKKVIAITMFEDCTFSTLTQSDAAKTGTGTVFYRTRLYGFRSSSPPIPHRA